MPESARDLLSKAAWAPVALIVLAFVSSGAWMVTRLPPVPAAKALQLGAVGIWLIVFAAGWVRHGSPDRRVSAGLAAVLTAVALSYIAGGWFFQVAFYDLYANMPLVQWLAFPMVFVLAARMMLEERTLRGALGIVVGIGVLISATMIYQQLTTNANWVFGTTAYSITALVPLIPVAAGLGLAASGAWRWAWLCASVFVSAALAFFSASLMGALAVAFAVLVTLAVWPASVDRRARGLKPIRLGAASMAVLMLAGVLFAQVPALSGRWVSPDAFDSPSLVSRTQLWAGAQDMVAERPVLGFGPSGYRVSAVEYLDPELFQFGPDVEGSIDPTVYSPQSPHSILWEILTRLGLVGLVAFVALAAAWVSALAARLGRRGPAHGLRMALAAGFLSALVAMLTNPVVFPIGLFAAVSAGLAVAPLSSAEPDGDSMPSRRFRQATGVSGLIVVAVSVWLFVGEWRAYTAPADDPFAAIAAHESTLRVLPSHPTTTRRLLETRLLVAADGSEVRVAQGDVDAAPAYISEYAPNLVSLAAYSLAQAERTGRSDIDWERDLLARAADRLPPIPSLVAEELHAALLVGDPEAVRAAIPDARRWGGPYPLTEGYLQRAETLLGDAE